VDVPVHGKLTAEQICKAFHPSQPTPNWRAARRDEAQSKPGPNEAVCEAALLSKQLHPPGPLQGHFGVLGVQVRQVVPMVFWQGDLNDYPVKHWDDRHLAPS